MKKKEPKFFILKGNYVVKLSAESRELAQLKLADAMNQIFVAADFYTQSIEESK